MGDKFSATNMVSMLAHRMGWNVNAPTCPFKQINCHKVTDDEAVVFILLKDDAALVRDQLALFPSDALVTKLRLMAGE